MSASAVTTAVSVVQLPAQTLLDHSLAHVTMVTWEMGQQAVYQPVGDNF